MKFNLSKQVVEMFLQQKSKKHGNVESTGEYFYLFGNAIARWNTKLGESGKFIEISDGKFKHTDSTKRYLKEIGASIKLTKNQFYIKEIKWNGDWLKLNEVPVNKEIKVNKSLFN